MKVSYSFNLPISNDEDQADVDTMMQMFENAASYVLEHGGNYDSQTRGRMMQNAITKVNKLGKRKRKNRSREEIAPTLLSLLWLATDGLLEEVQDARQK